jgi:hypothetical protein
MSIKALILALAVSYPAYAQSGDVYDNSGVRLGSLISIDTYTSAVTVATDRGYLVDIDWKGAIAVQTSTTYLASDCTGQTYAMNMRVVPVVFLSYGLNSTFDSRIMYVTPGAVALQLKDGSRYYQWVQINGAEVCSEYQVNTQYGPVWLVPSELNNPLETGIENGPFAKPLRLSGDLVFTHGFELT